ncbi:hypothetical protein ACVDG5_036590 [Mesorhizobium sp. ORM6]
MSISTRGGLDNENLVIADLGCLALAACDNSTEPMKANTDTVNKNPQVD